MTHAEMWTAGGLLALGGWHGLNPGMGWLFAVALGMQERSARAVWRTLPPLALGHAAAVAAALGAAVLLGRVVPTGVLQAGVAVALVAMGVWRLLRHRHPGGAGLRMGSRDLALWSFLMASAHGAGLMVVPLVLAPAAGSGAAMAHGGAPAGGMTAAGAGGWIPGLAATGLHTLAYLAVTGLLAAIVYRRLGVRWLRTGWINLDLIWGVTLVLTGLAVPVWSRLWA